MDLPPVHIIRTVQMRAGACLARMVQRKDNPWQVILCRLVIMTMVVKLLALADLPHGHVAELVVVAAMAAKA